MPDKLRVGVIGANVDAGWSPRAHLPAINALPDLELTAVCTAHEETARASAEKFGARLAFHDYEEMLRHPDIDAVSVVTRVPKHFEMTKAALEAGKHVYTEWPLGANLREADELANLARAKGVHTMVGLQARSSPVYLRLKELVEEGYVGEVLAVNMRQLGSGVLTRTPDRTWQSDKSLGANTLTISFGHSIDAMCMAVGEFVDVSAVVSTQVPTWHETETERDVDTDSPDNIIVNGHLEGGIVASAYVAALPYHGSGHRLEVYGREGTLVVEGSGARLLGGKGGESALEQLPIPERLTWVPESVSPGPSFNVAQMYQQFAEAIASGQRVEPDFDTAVVRQRLIDTVEKSSDQGVRLDLS